MIVLEHQIIIEQPCSKQQNIPVCFFLSGYTCSSIQSIFKNIFYCKLLLIAGKPSDILFVTYICGPTVLLGSKTLLFNIKVHLINKLILPRASNFVVNNNISPHAVWK